MSRSQTGTTARAIVDDVLGRGMTRDIWTANYDKALPVSVQDFDLTAVLPAVFYMFRFGHRRGKGKFIETFGGDGGTVREKKRTATIDRVASALSRADAFVGFNDEDDETERAILGDLLLSFCLENAHKALGRKEPILRVAPAHYMASCATRAATFTKSARRTAAKIGRSRRKPPSPHRSQWPRSSG